jgi:hypothetical protein
LFYNEKIIVLFCFSTIQRPSNDITEIGEFQIYLLAALGAVWILIFLAIFAGVRWLGKVKSF